ncbi:Alpha/beta hydrolase-3 [Melia azedarach]|uniref:Alpha/beta hydrolase-3 n=1 Tax=Melia azedarach TaxID=155640 RepID=A0ACC1XY34_MELAZ|nr:Alpha/beta hydrolase-3 [Melia azedarach]
MQLPLIVYIEGGGFCLGSAFDKRFHNFVSSLVANATAVSVEYRLAPEHPIPACHHDPWAALQWVASHANSDGPEQWLNNHADFRRLMQMEYSSDYTKIAHDFTPFFRVYKDGVVEKCSPVEKISPDDDPLAGVRSKDAIISTKPSISARIFIPRMRDHNMQLPLVVYYHGGGFCLGSAFDKRYHNFVSSLAAGANAIAVSVEYRLAPEHPIPACYEDSWAALQWVASHANGQGPEPWLTNHADFRRVFLVGDSGGANIIHNMMVREGISAVLRKTKLVGLAFMHPFFGGTDTDRMWLFLCPNNRGLLDPRLRPPAEDLGRVYCDTVLVFLSEKDIYRDAGKRYCDDLRRSGWRGSVEIVEQKGVGHIFHLLKPNCQQPVDLINRLVSFINQGKVMKLMSKI